MSRYTSLEGRIDFAAHRVLERLSNTGVSAAIIEFIVFGLKQAWACMFGGIMLAAVLVTAKFWPDDFGLARYDFLFLLAIAVQASMLIFKLEQPAEAKIIFIFHVVGTLMELFKTSAGSWMYPEANFFRIAGVPLFSGFMYAAVGSYIARITRIFNIQYSAYPKMQWTLVLAVLIYANFFTHHFIIDITILLFAGVVLLFAGTWVHFRVFRFRLKMPLLVGFLLVAVFIWFAENIGTWSGAWLYPGQETVWVPVSMGKLGSWYLLMIISFVLVTCVHRPKAPD